MLRMRPTYANVTATLALVVALGGTSYAAVAIAPNSVGTAQLKANAVTSAKVKDGALLKRDFKAGQLPAGPRGARGPAGPAGPLLTTLPVGKTLTGAFGLGGYASASGQPTFDSISFSIRLSSPPSAHVVVPGQAADPACPGTVAAPTALSGNLCVYQGFTESAPSDVAVFDPELGQAAASTFGVTVYAFSSSAGGFSTSGTWAVTG